MTDDPMPVFTIKGKDRLAVQAVDWYLALCQTYGLYDLGAEVWKAREEIRVWQERNPELVKLPDHPHVPVADEVEQAAVTACGDLARTLPANAELRRLARELVDAAETIRQQWAQADQAARSWMRDLLHTAADELRTHLDATDPEGPTT